MSRNPKRGIILCVCTALAALLHGGVAEAGLWGYRAAQDPMFGEGALVGAHSDVPPGWTMNRMDPVGQMGSARRDPFVSIDPTAGHIRETYSQGGVETEPPLVAGLDEYSTLLTERNYRKLWKNSSRDSRSVLRGARTRQRGPLSYDIPIQIPKFARGLLGSGTPNIDVSGSETITFSGVSDWTVRPPNSVVGERKRPSAFPSLEMKQDLQVNLTGSIGDKIKVDVDQSSNVQTSLDNKVKLRYEGDEDDMIKSIDLGNTNLSLQGASIRREGLFGVKTVAKLGNVDLVTIASKQEGKSETSRFTPSGEKRHVKIADLDYIKRQYFFISDHQMVWHRGTLQVWRDDGNGFNNTGNTLPGIARFNPRADSTDVAGNPQVHGTFDVLTQGTDFDVFFPYKVTDPTARLGTEIPVIKLRYPLNPNDVLAVAYVEDSAGVDLRIGDPDPNTENTSLGKPLRSVLLKMIKPSFDGLTTIPGGRFDPSDKWYRALAYELRNFYDLTARNIARETVVLKVRKLEGGQSVDPDAINRKPLLEILGLDQKGTQFGTAPDGRIDDQFLETESGVVFFQDLHPYAPGCAATPGFQCMDDTNRNILGDSTLANPNVYYTKAPDFTSQTRYYIDAEFKSSRQGTSWGASTSCRTPSRSKSTTSSRRRTPITSSTTTPGSSPSVARPGPTR